MAKANNKIVRLKINPCIDRTNLCGILAGNGYKVWVETKENEGEYRMDTNYYVCFEMKYMGIN